MKKENDILFNLIDSHFILRNESIMLKGLLKDFFYKENYNAIYDLYLAELNKNEKLYKCNALFGFTKEQKINMVPLDVEMGNRKVMIVGEEEKNIKFFVTSHSDIDTLGELYYNTNLKISFKKNPVGRRDLVGFDFEINNILSGSQEITMFAMKTVIAKINEDAKLDITRIEKNIGLKKNLSNNTYTWSFLDNKFEKANELSKEKSKFLNLEPILDVLYKTDINTFNSLIEKGIFSKEQSEILSLISDINTNNITDYISDSNKNIFEALTVNHKKNKKGLNNGK